ncbi:MAG: tRNA (N(6)-L-threonylcarbamoyladenosine(37)-C(2))-methylthiotransferase MtaB [Planctomycetes bacterium]|nr:tRNA (N(6)-L-threonylcarbamoyladenosine(37)-C(2))-methylthiotransferase MtaB [Planctomycetota bacterium]
MPTFASVTFGCKVNQYESQALREELLRRGYAEVPAGDRPDLYLVNTCTVTETARKEAEKLVRSLSRGRPDARFAITGCAADSFPGIPGVRSVVPQAEKHRLPDLLDGGRTGEEGGGVFDLRISRFDGHTRAFVKVEDGCDLSCSFCIIPKVRGGPVSRPIPAVLDEIRRLLDHGHKEIVLTGVHLGAYGRDLERRPTIPDLVEAVLKLAVARVRLSSIEVNEIEERLIDLLGAEPRRLCPHLHLPLQSGDEGILRAMRRRYSPRQFLAACERVAARVPDPSFTTDVIVGFPGETEERFERSVEICRRIGMSRIHVFPYSPRPGTEAAALPDDVPRSVKRARLNRLKAEASRLTQEFCRRFVGREVDVLVEEDPSTS